MNALTDSLYLLFILCILQTMRYLENSYDKTKLKEAEADHLGRIYREIKDKLEVVGFIYVIAPDKRGYLHNNFLISQ